MTIIPIDTLVFWATPGSVSPCSYIPALKLVFPFEGQNNLVIVYTLVSGFDIDSIKFESFFNWF